MAYVHLHLSPNLLTIYQEVMGRLDHLVEAVYDRFKDRYFKSESTSPISACRSFLIAVSRSARRYRRRQVCFSFLHIILILIEPEQVLRSR
jgi:hypothetical protein